jgi:polar amino acid transport system substrate-binding protein
MYATLTRRTLTALLLVATGLCTLSGQADTLQRIRNSQTLNLGLVPGDAPFSAGSAEQPSGYAIELCRLIGEQLQQQLGLPHLQLHYQQLTVIDMLDAVALGKVDTVCGAVGDTLKRREQVSFSLPFFAAGLGVVVRRDAPASLLKPITEGVQPRGPVWRATLNQGLNRHSFAVLKDSVTVDWARTRMRALGLQSQLREVSSNAEGLALVAEGKVDAFFADRLVLLNYQAEHAQGSELLIPDRLFEVLPVALPLPRGDEDFRLAVDRALSAVQLSSAGQALYQGYFGAPSEQTQWLMKLYVRPE